VIEVMKDEEADADSWNYGKGLMESGWKNVRGEEKNRLKNNNMTPVQEIGASWLASFIISVRRLNYSNKQDCMNLKKKCIVTTRLYHGVGYRIQI
jgi:hypothetical protein